MIQHLFNFFYKDKKEITAAANKSSSIETSIKDIQSNISQPDKSDNSSSNNENEIILTEQEIIFFIDEEVKIRLSNYHPQSFDIQDLDPLFKEAAEIIVKTQQGSASLLQKILKLGYNRAGRLIDQLESTGIVGPFEGSKSRAVFIPDLKTLDSFLSYRKEGETFFFRNKTYNEKKAFFENNILPDKISIIEEKVNDILIKIEEANIVELKESIRQEILEKENKKRTKEQINSLRQEVFQEMIEEGILKDENIKKGRSPISQGVLDKVWNRDQGKCVRCNSQENLEFDHIIPYSKGGANTYRNLQLLCEKCNRSKSNKIG